MLLEIESLIQFEQIIKENPNILLITKFYDIWCAPCKIMEPIFLNLIQKIESENNINFMNNKPLFLSIEREKTQDLIQKYEFRIPTIPRFFYTEIQNGQIIKNIDLDGTQSMDRLLLKIKNNLDK